jgi:hypothetical protein
MRHARWLARLGGKYRMYTHHPWSPDQARLSICHTIAHPLSPLPLSSPTPRCHRMTAHACCSHEADHSPPNACSRIHLLLIFLLLNYLELGAWYQIHLEPKSTLSKRWLDVILMAVNLQHSWIRPVPTVIKAFNHGVISSYFKVWKILVVQSKCLEKCVRSNLAIWSHRDARTLNNDPAADIRHNIIFSSC